MVEDLRFPRQEDHFCQIPKVRTFREVGPHGKSAGGAETVIRRLAEPSQNVEMLKRSAQARDHGCQLFT